MSCIDPIKLKNGQIVPCGKCINCLKDRQKDWVFRLMNELRVAEFARVYTLTYDNDHVEYLNKLHVQKFIKRVRKELTDKYGFAIKYFCAGEYGKTTHRPHYHLIMFFYDIPVKVENDLYYIDKYVIDKWHDGFVYADSVDQATIVYCTKYILKDPDFLPVGYVPKIVTSKKNGVVYNRVGVQCSVQLPFMICSNGLGLRYVDENIDRIRSGDIQCVAINQYRQRLPRYYRSKIFTDDYKFGDLVRDCDIDDAKKLIRDLQVARFEERLESQLSKIARKYNISLNEAMDRLEQSWNNEQWLRVKQFHDVEKKDLI